MPTKMTWEQHKQSASRLKREKSMVTIVKWCREALNAASENTTMVDVIREACKTFTLNDAQTEHLCRQFGVAVADLVVPPAPLPTCPSCEKPCQPRQPGEVCPNCGHVEVEETED
jgi:hypothetical protein